MLKGNDIASAGTPSFIAALTQVPGVDHPFIINEFGVDHVEIIKGPTSLLYGSDAVGKEQLLVSGSD